MTRTSNQKAADKRTVHKKLHSATTANEAKKGVLIGLCQWIKEVMHASDSDHIPYGVVKEITKWYQGMAAKGYTVNNALRAWRVYQSEENHLHCSCTLYHHQPLTWDNLTLRKWGNATVIYWHHSIIIHRITLQMWQPPQRNNIYEQKDCCWERETGGKWNCHHLESISQWCMWESSQEHAQWKPQATDPREKNTSQHDDWYFPETIKSHVKRNKLVVTKRGITSLIDKVKNQIVALLIQMTHMHQPLNAILKLCNLPMTWLMDKRLRKKQLNGKRNMYTSKMKAMKKTTFIEQLDLDTDGESWRGTVI